MPKQNKPAANRQPPISLHNPELAAKLSPAAKRHLMASEPEAAASGDLQPEARALLRTTAPLGPEERQALEAAGATVRTVAGDVLTATLRLDRIDAIVELPFVRYLDLARPLHPEKER